MDESERHELSAKYMPTPEEIREMCAEIRKEWSEQTERTRRAPERPVCLDSLHRIAEDDE